MVKYEIRQIGTSTSCELVKIENGKEMVILCETYHQCLFKKLQLEGKR